MFLIFNLLFLVFSFPSFAGNGVGNGGNAVVCYDRSGAVVSAELLDIYEAGLVADSKIDFKDSFKAAAEIIMGLNQVHSVLANQFKKRLDEIKNEIEFRDGISLVTIDDSFHLIKPKDEKCKIKQVAIRRANILATEKRFIFDNEIWNRLSDFSKTSLLLHELIYEYFSKLGETDSRKARIYNAKLLSGELIKMSKSKYWGFIKSLKIPIYPQ